MASLLASLFGKDKEEERDLSFGLVKQHGVDRLIRQHQWDRVETIAKTLTDDELTRLLDGICLTEKYQAELMRYAKSASPEFAHLVTGSWYLYLAWQARTGKWAEELSKSEIDGFIHYLQLAATRLQQVESTPAMRSEAQARLVRTWMGLSEADEAINCFERSVEAGKDKFLAYHHMFKLLSPKWLGDEQALVGFIQSVEQPAISYALWLMYAVEMFSDYNSENEQTAHRRWYAEYKELLDQLLPMPRLAIDNSMVSIYANNNLAYVYHLLGERDQRNQVLDQLGERLPAYPWAYFGVESESNKAMKSFRATAAYPRP